MTTEVIILCQGTQSRLGMDHGHKQLLTLPACGVPILVRTLALVRHMVERTKITVIGWPEMFTRLRFALSDLDLPGIDGLPTSGRWPWLRNVELLTLPDPGNSSLKGIARYLENRDPQTGRSTMVLLGDVVYSWACLEAIQGTATAWGSGFVGTGDLRPDGGELWGVAWDGEFENPMVMSLRDALLAHPPFAESYQPGQMRRWLCPRGGDLVGRVAELRRRMRYAAIDDYTMDVDLPKDIPLLHGASVQAAADDAAHGLHWNRPG